jgi:predicted transcriptional regulator
MCVATKNTTFKLSDEDLASLKQLAEEMRRSRADVLRLALAELAQRHREQHAAAEALIEQTLASVPEGSTLMIGLDENMEPYATISGRERRADLKVVGQRFSLKGEEFVRVFLLDPDPASELRLDAGVIQARTGGWLAILDPLPVNIAYAE